MLEISHLLLVVDAYRIATNVPDTTVSNRLFKDTKKIANLRAGGELYVGRFNDALRWFDANWPEGAVWPAGVLRP